MSASETGFYQRFKAQYGTEKTLKVFSANDKKIEIFYEQDTGLGARVVCKDGGTKAIAKEWITGIPKEISADPDKIKMFLDDAAVSLKGLDKDDYHLYINQRLKGGGNFMENFLDLLPPTTITIFVRFASKHSSQQREQLKDLVEKGVSYWARSGFLFKFAYSEARDEISMGLNERPTYVGPGKAGKRSLYAPSHYSAEGRNAIEETADIFIDFNAPEKGDADAKSIAGQAFTMQTRKGGLSGAGSSGRIVADCKRNNVSDIPHEIGHAVFKLLHEHARVDRDQYVAEDKLGQEGAEQYAQKGIPFGHYDDKSVMHYPACFRYKNSKVLVMGGKEPSELDLLSARFLYNEARIKEQIAQEIAKLDADLESTAPHGGSWLPKVIQEKETAIKTQEAEAKLQRERAQKMRSNVANPRQLTIDAIHDQSEQLNRLQFTFGNMDGELLSYAATLKKEIQVEQQQTLQQFQTTPLLSTSLHNPYASMPTTQTLRRRGEGAASRGIDLNSPDWSQSQGQQVPGCCG